MSFSENSRPLFQQRRVKSGKNLNFAVIKAAKKCINLQAFSFFFHQKFFSRFFTISFIIRLEKWVFVSAKFDVSQHCAAENYYTVHSTMPERGSMKSLEKSSTFVRRYEIMMMMTMQ